jgi:hypothetical protein
VPTNRWFPLRQPATAWAFRGAVAASFLVALGAWWWLNPSVIWCTGFRADYGWIELPAFDGKGYPVHERGTSPVEGLYFLGLPWLYTRAVPLSVLPGRHAWFT